MQNKTNTQRHKFNIFDVVLILVFLAIIGGVAALVIRSVPKGEVFNGNSEVTYVMSVTGVHTEIAEQVKKGQKLYDASTGQEIGIISSVTVFEHIVTGVDQQTQTPVTNIVPGKGDLEITVAVAASHKGEIYEVNGTVIACGEKISFRTETAALSGVCISMNAQK